MKVVSNFCFVCWVWLISGQLVFAQSRKILVPDTLEPYRNDLYTELLGNGLIASVNYERLFPLASHKCTIVTRLGTMVWLGDSYGDIEYTLFLPTEVGLLLGTKSIKPEYGLGVTVINERYTGYNWQAIEYKTINNWYPVGFVRVGFRYNRPGSRFVGRAGFTPFIMPEKYNSDVPNVWPWIGLSLGFYFGR